jgi:NAD(P)-dependent dehydrogenase (short-subunit alcohol dehydrogenase family)
MDINFFGLIDVTRKALEVMRELKTGGVIQQVTSIGGQIGKHHSPGG